MIVIAYRLRFYAESFPYQLDYSQTYHDHIFLELYFTGNCLALSLHVKLKLICASHKHTVSLISKLWNMNMNIIHYKSLYVNSNPWIIPCYPPIYLIYSNVLSFFICILKIVVEIDLHLLFKRFFELLLQKPIKSHVMWVCLEVDVYVSFMLHAPQL